MKKKRYILFLVFLAIILIGCINQIRRDKIETTNEDVSLINKNGEENGNIQKITKEDWWYKPKPGISWQLQLQGNINKSYDVDLYDFDLVETPKTVIDELHNKNITVICYISTGSLEEFRNDAKDFPKEVIGKIVAGWPEEKWLDISDYDKFTDIILSRLNLAVQKECDGIDPDNIQAYQEDSGFPLTYQDQLNYNKWLADEAHKRNRSIALKNDIEQVDNLIDYFDFAINEQCFYYDECEKLLPFIKHGKAVLGMEYELKFDEFCEKAIRLNFSWLKMNYDLNGSRISCR